MLQFAYIFSFAFIAEINTICSSASSGAKALPKQGLRKPEQNIKRQKLNNPPGNMVELDAVSSDDDEINIVLRH
jgi:minichromosome maintenance protein 10